MMKYSDYMNTEETANFVGVTRQTVEHWRRKGWLLPDVIGHGKNGRGGVYYYSKERILQLASVYQKKNCKQTANAPMGDTNTDSETATTANCVIDSPVEVTADEINQTVTTKDFLPMSTAPNFDEIPQVLKDLPRWLCWQLRPVNGRLSKVPMTPKNGKLVNASVTDSKNWLTFNEAVDWFNRGLCTGIGFALTNTPPKVCCVDVDHCFSDDGNLTNEAQDVMAMCKNAFTEKSQSGKGIHVWFIDDDFGGGRRKGNVEVYAADRYIAMTGNRLANSAKELLTVNGACNAIVAKFMGDVGGNSLFDKPARKADEKINIDINAETAAPLSDGDRRLVEYFRSEKCRSRDSNMFDLFGGNTAAYFKNTGKAVDDSVADCDLVLKILFYVGGNDDSDDSIGRRALNIFGQSALSKRDKWQAREDYRIRTLNAAFDIWNKNGREAIKPMTINKPVDAVKDNDNSAQIDSLKAALRDVNKAIADFNTEKDEALERLRNGKKFDSDTVFSEEIMTAAAFAFFADPKSFSDFRGAVKNYGDKHRDEKVNVPTWYKIVKDRSAEIAKRQADLLTRRNEIKAQIDSLVFVGSHDFLQGIKIPQGYSVSAENGIAKVDGEKSRPVCVRPVVITGKTFSVEDKIFKLSIAYLSATGKLETLEPTEAAIVFNSRRIVDLANNGLPVTSNNAALLVDYLYQFCAANEITLPLTKLVNRCGWYNFNGNTVFIDPRRPCVIQQDSEQNFDVKVDESRSDFARNLRSAGNLDEWRKIYELAKKSPVARLMVAAAVAPPLLYVLGERNFMLYIYAPTRAGKTTALYLAASAVGSENIIRSFDATKNGLAGAAADCNDYVFCVDEKQVADSKLREELESIVVYALTNGTGRTKLNKNSTLRILQFWRTILLSTGETEFLGDNVTGGAHTRLLTIKALQEILDAKTCKKIRDTTKHNYGLAFPLVVDKILEFGRDKLREIFEEIIAAFDAAFPEILPEYRRYMAVLTLADTLLNSVLFGNTATAPDGTTIKASDDAIINAANIFPLIPTITEISDAPRAKDWLLGVINMHQNHFVGGNVDDISRIQGIWGSLNDGDGYTYITVTALKEACKRDGRDYRKVVSDLVGEGVIVPDEKIKGNRKTPLKTVQKKIGKINATCYRIPQSAFGNEE